RPHLDGLRALAVGLVVAFHSGLGWFTGGYVGVDVFFVLSGFLVTRLLVADVRHRGRIDLRRFYARRFRRLLPAAAVTLVVTAAVFTALASRVEVAEGVGSFRAAFLYVTNWHFIREGAGYFGADLTADPVLHFWSLAVEEQFYLLWPLALTGLLVATRRLSGRSRARALTIVVTVATVASAGWAVILRDRDPLRSYYGTDARAYQLLAGALLALSPGLIRRMRRSPAAARIAATLALLAVPVVGSRLVDLGPVNRGLAITAVTVLLLAALEGASDGSARAALSRPTMVTLGRISYGIYLWHWPVIWVIDREFSATPIETFAVTAFVATGLAAASNLLLEQPIRRSVRLDRHRLAVIATGLAVSLVGALVVVPRITDRATGRVVIGGATPSVGGIDPRTLDLSGTDWKGTFPGCEGEAPEACTVRRGRGAHVLLIGDSHARAILPAFRAIADRDDLTLSVAISGGCPWQRGLYATPVLGAAVAEQCRDRKEDLYTRVLPALSPDLVVATNFPYERTGAGRAVGYLGWNR
ncbi:MAG: acyltransferase family protein, partial [Actinomycetota bacterium]